MQLSGVPQAWSAGSVVPGMADEHPSWVAEPDATGKQVYLTTARASTPWEPKPSRFHRYLVWSGFGVALAVLAWAAWSVHGYL